MTDAVAWETAPVEANSVAATSMEAAAAEGTFIDELVQAVRARLADRRIWRATYRLQFQAAKAPAAQFRFEDAGKLASYLSDLGVSHVYASPCLKTRSGSTHGYDVVDYTHLNDELGNAAEYDAYVAALHEHGVGQLLDIVPNHMSVGTDENTWWNDVLMNGPASPHAGYFDIDWHPGKRDLQDKVLLPVLDDFYGNVLEAGRLGIRYRDGAFYATCGTSQWPLDPQTWTRILSSSLESLTTALGADSPALVELQSITTALRNLPPRAEADSARLVERHRERQVVQSRLRRLVVENPAIAAFIDGNLAVFHGTPGDSRSFDALNTLLDEQAFRLVHWRAGSDELNYRRFFDVTELAAVCMENVEVFQATHARVFDLVVQGKVDGLRIDHVDGLFDPTEYLWRLHWGLLRAWGRAEHERLVADQASPVTWLAVEAPFLKQMHSIIGGPDPFTLFTRRGNSTTTVLSDSSVPTDITVAADEPVVASLPTQARPPLPIPVWVEKILGADEPLPTDWPVTGTTGYDFTNLVNGLFVHEQGYRSLERKYRRFVELHEDFREVVYDCKRVILDGPMQSEIQLLAHRLERLARRHRRTRDYTLQALRSALREIIACFSVYRTYVRHGRVSERDRRVIQLAVALARRLNPATDVSVYGFIRDVLLLTQPPELDAAGLAERELFIGRFQQVTSPVMAKGVEDTAFYRDLPLTSLNEVGGDPGHAATSVADFHKQNVARMRQWPQTLLASTTHDTKRSEDVRARINVLSEMPERWASAIRKWSRWNHKHTREVDGQVAPSKNDQWLFYQTLVGVWPLAPADEAERQTFVGRMQGYMEKATHEAKLRTSWISPNAAYDEAVRNFVAGVLQDDEGRFLTDFQAFHDSIISAGLYTAAAQTLLKFLSPGIPDLYQGQELWDFNLVDPDNRRPVDFDRRRRLLAEVVEQTSTSAQQAAFARYLAQHPHDDRFKLFVTWVALGCRRDFSLGVEANEYVPLAVEGERSAHLCAFAWRVDRHDALSRHAVVVAPRLLFQLCETAENRLPCGPDVWKDTTVVLPNLPCIELQDRFTRRRLNAATGRLSAAEILTDFPLALLTT